MRFKDLLKSDMYWVGLGLFVGLPFAARLVLGQGFDFGNFVFGVIIYTIIITFLVKYIK